MSFTKAVLMAAIAAALQFNNASATVLTPYIGTDLDGSELASALADNSTVFVVGSSSDFQGNQGGFEGSAAFFEDLNFGTTEGVDFVLPDGIFLSSGNGDLPTENTEPGFTGFASGSGDAGLDLLLDNAGFADQTTDATVLSFDFTVADGVNAVALDFIFGSEEFPEFADAFPEIAGIFVDGTNIAAFEDGSLLTVTSAGIDAGNFIDNNIFDNGEFPEGEFPEGEFPEFTATEEPPVTPFNGDVAPLAIEFDGVSVPLTAVGALDTSLDTHSIKIAVSDTGDTSLDTGIFLANLRGLSAGGGGFDGPGSSSDDPLLPTPDFDPTDGFDFQVFVGEAGIGIDPTQPIFFDPDVAIGYEFFSNIAITTAQVATDFGDGVYTFDVWNGSAYEFFADFVVDEVLDLTSLEFDVFQWRITGIETSAMVDPTDNMAFVSGYTFATAGLVELSQIPITEFVGDSNPPGSAPVPNSVLLIALGALAMRRRLAARPTAG